MQDPDINCALCSDRGHLATDYGIVRCDCNAGKTVDLIPERTPEQHRATAYDWHGGQWSPLYQWASTNGEHIDYPAIMTEMEACIGQARLECNETEYDNLRSLRRHLAVTYAPEIDYDAVPF